MDMSPYNPPLPLATPTFDLVPKVPSFSSLGLRIRQFSERRAPSASTLAPAARAHVVSAMAIHNSDSLDECAPVKHSCGQSGLETETMHISGAGTASAAALMNTFTAATASPQMEIGRQRHATKAMATMS